MAKRRKKEEGKDLLSDQDMNGVVGGFSLVSAKQARGKSNVIIDANGNRCMLTSDEQRTWSSINNQLSKTLNNPASSREDCQKARYSAYQETKSKLGIDIGWDG